MTPFDLTDAGRLAAALVDDLATHLEDAFGFERRAPGVEPLPPGAAAVLDLDAFDIGASGPVALKAQALRDEGLTGHGPETFLRLVVLAEDRRAHRGEAMRISIRSGFAPSPQDPVHPDGFRTVAEVGFSRASDLSQPKFSALLDAFRQSFPAPANGPAPR